MPFLIHKILRIGGNIQKPSAIATRQAPIEDKMGNME